MTKEKMTKSEWLKANGFSEDGKTYLVIGNSYGIKDDLKAKGFKFSPLLRWHGDSNEYALPSNCYYYVLYYSQIFIWNEEQGVTFMKEGARDFLDNLFNPPRQSLSKYQGSIGDKLNISNCEVVNVGGYAGGYGYTWIYTFRDKCENEYSWFTTVNKALSIGMICNVTGTIKEFKEYKGVETTVLTRCKIEVTNERI